MSVTGYLLDANHAHAWERGESNFIKRYENVHPLSLVRVCTITLGEMESGFRMTADQDPARRSQCRAFMDRELRKFALDVTVQTSLAYADIMERIWNKHKPQKGVKTERHLVDKGVDINDVWIVAVALERGFTLLTTDSMAVIRDVVSDVQFENWTV